MMAPLDVLQYGKAANVHGVCYEIGVKLKKRNMRLQESRLRATSD
jgi:hypothetical protein